MEQQGINQKILEKLDQIQIDINILKKRLQEDEHLPSVEEQLEMGLEDMKKGEILKLA
jgi:DNA-binding transcriptional regulator YhcF (GntR family)